MNNKILLIDGSSIFFRAYYGTAYNSANILRNSKGQAVNAIITFYNMFQRYTKEINPTHVFIAFDSGKKTRRHEEFPDYKGTRVKQPEDLISQFKPLFHLLDEMNISHKFKDGIEADDLIASLAWQHKDKNDIVIISSDKDLYQLVSEKTTILSPKKGTEMQVVDNLNFHFLNGYTPEQTTSLKGLLGDPSDNLPGVKGIGEKTAKKLLEQFNDLEHIYENIDSIDGKTKEKLIASKDIAMLCKKLATLLINEKVDITMEEMSYPKEPKETIKDFLTDLELWQILKKYK